MEMCALLCSLVQFGETWFRLVQLGADWCNVVQIDVVF